MRLWAWGPYRPSSVLIHAKDQRIGDAFMQVPFFREARSRFPQAKITLAVSLGGTPYRTSLHSVAAPFIDEIIEEAHLCDRHAQMFEARPLDGRLFDLVIDMQKTWWRTLAIRRIRHRRFISASKHYLFSSRRPRLPWKPPHLLEQYLKLLEAAGGETPADETPLHWYGESERQRAAECLPVPGAIGLVPGAGEAFKRWPLERYLALASRLAAAGRRPAFILGPLEQGWIDPIRTSLPEAPIPGWTGPGAAASGLAPLEIAALGERLQAVVTNDCGTAHMLAASGVPMLSLFGATNPVKYRPATPTHHWLQRAAQGPDAILAISVGDAMAALVALIDGLAPVSVSGASGEAALAAAET